MSTHCSSIPTETADPAKQVCRYGTGDNCVVGRVTFLSLRPTTDRPQDCMVKETLDSLRCVGMHASFDRMRSRISSYDSTCEDDYGQHCRLSSDSAPRQSSDSAWAGDPRPPGYFGEDDDSDGEGGGDDNDACNILDDESAASCPCWDLNLLGAEDDHSNMADIDLWDAKGSDFAQEFDFEQSFVIVR